MAFVQITRLTRDPHTSKFQITYPNSKKITILCTPAVFFKKKKTKQNKKKYSYVHPMKRVDEVGSEKNR